jgi:uncharacterized protein YjbI with pentapeptide repeats
VPTKTVRRPAKPKPPATLDPATADHDLVDEASLRRLGFIDTDLSGRTAMLAEVEQCRFRSADLSNCALERTSFIDCLVEDSDLANLRTVKSSLQRVQLSATRMTGLHWVDGALREVTIADCRANLSSFRFTAFHNVLFENCVLTGADFQNADLTGARFVGCDLTGAQFSHAKMAGTRLSDCVLAGLGGVSSMAGATVSGADLVTLTYTLAAALGIRIDDSAGSAPTL